MSWLGVHLVLVVICGFGYNSCHSKFNVNGLLYIVVIHINLLVFVAELEMLCSFTCVLCIHQSIFTSAQILLVLAAILQIEGKSIVRLVIMTCDCFIIMLTA
jgi:hypothetical protein